MFKPSWHYTPFVRCQIGVGTADAWREVEGPGGSNLAGVLNIEH